MFEIIVVNDGSTDRGVERVHSVSDSRIKVIEKENGGVCSARNEGIKQANFEYVAFLDADDFWEPDYLLEQSRLIADFDDAGLWGCAFGFMHGNLKEKLNHVLPIAYRDYVRDYFEMQRKTDLFHTSALVIRKSVFDIAGMFDERIKFSEDLDMWYRVINLCPIVFYNKTYAYYQQEAENRALNKRIKLIDYLPYYIDKYNEDPKYNNDTFLSYINNWAAVKIQHYYFHSRNERPDAREAIRKLDFQKIHSKYKLMYKSPFVIGFFAYQVVNLKKWIWRHLSV